ncbi:vesicle-trafficking protein SEC22c isoform X2 [Phascolarctos cinereus]
MSMILFACVVRVRDGLPLSASTDFHHNQDFLECRKQLKTLSLILTQFPGRGTAEGHDLNIHFDSSGAIACMGICSRSYPVAMAFCFLEALRWEFTASYDNTSIGLASRPYAFLKFDSVIQKVKWHFNYASSSQLKNHLEKIQEELLLQPPLVLRLEDTEVMNGLRSNHSPMQAEYAPNYRMKPVTALGILSLILNIMCAALNLIRGIHLAEHSFQCYLYLFYSSTRLLKVAVILFFICLCNIYLHGLRNLWQILFHIGVAFLSSYQILTRQLRDKVLHGGV